MDFYRAERLRSSRRRIISFLRRPSRPSRDLSKKSVSIRVHSWLNFSVFAIPKTMRAVVYRGVNDLRLETVPVPRLGAERTARQGRRLRRLPHRHQKNPARHRPAAAHFRPRNRRHDCQDRRWGERPREPAETRRPRGAAPSRAVPEMPFLPAPRLRPMRDLQAHRHHRRFRTGRRRLCRIRPRDEIRFARRRENSRQKFLRRRRDARTRQHRAQGRRNG